MGREFLQYKTHGKSQQNKRQALTKPTQHNLKIQQQNFIITITTYLGKNKNI